MAVNRIQQLMATLSELRLQPTTKRVRVLRGDTLVAETAAPVLIWEPKRVVPAYAIPDSDFTVALEPAAAAAGEEHVVRIGDGPPMLDPSTGFAVHTTDGTTLSAAGGGAFRLAEPGLDHLIVLDFDAFDWFEEDEPIFGHPRDPFSRIDLRQSSRSIRVERDGLVLAESNRPTMLFESVLPERYYIPRADVLVDLHDSDTETACPYKGHATHWSTAGARDIAWSYEHPVPELQQIAGMVCFYQEKTDFVIDGTPLERTRTPWSEQ